MGLYLHHHHQTSCTLSLQRSSHLRTHGGEVALPGGKKDPEDADLIATALREANEEIGLSSDLVEILTTFKAASSKHNLLVTPVVGLLKDSPTPFIPPQTPPKWTLSSASPSPAFLTLPTTNAWTLKNP
ncbi:hypothetical protein BC829DRAFT_177121 [Chytridium lagenaria]|nr:hypothetical protein BC829DRAFT_177121 [Chytridium lagenaria]